MFLTSRILSFAPREVYDAFARPDVLERWWGPAGFRNAFETFEFKPGGKWKYMMYGPNGATFANESVFQSLDDPSRIVIHHISKPRYVLTVTLAPHANGTELTWAQEFEDSGVAARIKHIVEPANEQNLDRLESVLSGKTP